MESCHGFIEIRYHVSPGLWGSAPSLRGWRTSTMARGFTSSNIIWKIEIQKVN